MRFLIDEDLPRTLAPALAASGHDVVDGRDVGLRTSGDDDVFAYAQRESRALLTMDLDFADDQRFPLGPIGESSSRASRTPCARACSSL